MSDNIQYIQRQIDFHSQELTSASEDGDIKRWERHDKELHNYLEMLRQEKGE